MAPDKGYRSQSNKIAKKRRSERSLPKTKATTKKRIRDLQRAMRRHDTFQKTEEISELAERDAALSAERRRIATEKWYAARYRKVKFFERRKVDRKLQRVRRELENEPSAELRRREQQLKDDLDYIRYYPKTKKYISLFMDDDTGLRAKMREEALAAAQVARA